MKVPKKAIVAKNAKIDTSAGESRCMTSCQTMFFTNQHKYFKRSPYAPIFFKYFQKLPSMFSGYTGMHIDRNFKGFTNT